MSGAAFRCDARLGIRERDPVVSLLRINREWARGNASRRSTVTYHSNPALGSYASVNVSVVIILEKHPRVELELAGAAGRACR